MKNTTTTIAVILVLLALIIIAVLVHRNDGAEINNEGTQENTEKASFFTGEALFILENYEGKEVSSHDFDTEILVINTWATWCPFCVNELPDFAELAERYPEDVTVVAINRAEPPLTAKSFSDKLNIDESILFLVDPNDKFYKSIGGFSMPETLFVNKKGDILLHKRGPMKFDEMSELVESFLSS